MSKNCSQCGAPLTDSAHFCQRCGAPVHGAPVHGPPVRATSASGAQILPWAVAAIALLSPLGFIVGQNWRRATPVAATAVPAGATPIGERAPDISQMSPDERADRLFNRVMTYVTEGKRDSVQFFAPMAIQAFESLAPLNAHRRYDLGLIGVVSADGAMARAQADTILASEPTHLLGLILGMRAAGLQFDSDARRGYARRFVVALEAERAKRLPEYIDHQPDIDDALRDIDDPSKNQSAVPPAAGTTDRTP